MAWLPSLIAVLTLDQDRSTGRLDLVSYHNVDTSPAHGLVDHLWREPHPGGTHLSSEEYEPDATVANNDSSRASARTSMATRSKAKPYHYGHLPEVTVHPDGTGSIRKHYVWAASRTSWCRSAPTGARC